MHRRKGREWGEQTWSGGCSSPAKGPTETWAARSKAAAAVGPGGVNEEEKHYPIEARRGRRLGDVPRWPFR